MNADSGAAPDGERIACWAAQERALRAFAHVARALHEAGVSTAPVKGVALARWLYADPSDRPLSDADALVRRADFARACDVVHREGWPVAFRSAELGKIDAFVRGFLVELHAEIVRPDLTSLSVDDLFARSVADEATFGVPVRRLDDVDHLVYVAANAVKDGLVRTQLHVPGDLDRLLAQSWDRRDEVLARFRDAGFVAGLACVAEWMAEDVGSERWRELRGLLGRSPRPLHAAVARVLRRAGGIAPAVCIAMACWTPDDPAVRRRGMGRLLRRRAIATFGRDPH